MSTHNLCAQTAGTGAVEARLTDRQNGWPVLRTVDGRSRLYPGRRPVPARDRYRSKAHYWRIARDESGRASSGYSAGLGCRLKIEQMLLTVSVLQFDGRQSFEIMANRELPGHTDTAVQLHAFLAYLSAIPTC